MTGPGALPAKIDEPSKALQQAIEKPPHAAQGGAEPKSDEAGRTGAQKGRVHYLHLRRAPQAEGIDFFWQRWREALDTSAPVSVRARTSGPRELLRELRAVERTIAQSGFGSGDRTALHEEAFGANPNGVALDGVVPGDPVVRSAAPSFAETWGHIDQAFLTGSLPEEVKSARRAAVLRNLEHLLDHTYRAGLYSALNDILFVDTGLAKQASEGQETESDSVADRIDVLVSALVTDLLGEGFSAFFLRARGEAVAARMLESEKESREVLREFFDRLERGQEATRVVVKAKASKDFWQTWGEFSANAAYEERTGAIPGNFAERAARTSKRKFDDTSEGGIRFICWIVDAHDRGHAARQAYQQFERVSDAVCFAVPGVSPALLNAVATIRQADPHHLDVVNPKDAEFTFRPLRISLGDTRARRPALAALKAENAQSQVSIRRLTGALRAQRIARDENWLESSITSLWTAVETLSHERYGGSVIDGVVRSVVPFVAGTKIRDLTDDLVAYLDRAGVTELERFQSDYSDVIEGELVSSAKLLVALSDRTRATQLATLSSGSPLLRFRIRRYHAAVRTVREAAVRSCQTAKRVDWQLRRVYRLRNGIIHGAQFGGTGEQLLEHLDSYVRAVLGPLSLILSAQNGIESIEQAIAAVDAEFESWRQWALKQKSPPTESDAARLLRAPYEGLIGV